MINLKTEHIEHIYSIIVSLLFIIVLLLWLKYRKKQSIVNCFLASAFTFFVGVTVSGMLSSYSHSSFWGVMANVFLLLSYIFLHIALFKLINKKLRLRLILIFFISFLILLITFVYFIPMGGTGTIILNIFILIANVCFVLQYRKADSKKKRYIDMIIIYFHITIILNISLTVLTLILLYSIGLKYISPIATLITMILNVGFYFMIIFMVLKWSRSEIKKSEEYFQTIFNLSSTGTAIVAADSTIVKVNAKFCSMLEYGADELIKKKYSEICYQDSHSPCFDNIAKPKSDNAPINDKTIEKRFLKSDGTAIWAEVASTYIDDVDGEPAYYIISIMDITDHKYLEQLLRKANAEAQEASNAKSEFLSIISHEIRTPMTTMLGIIHLMRDKATDTEFLDYFEKIDNASNMLLCIINDMLDVTKFESGKLSLENISFSLRAVIKNITTMNKVNAEADNLKFEYSVDENIPYKLIGDPNRISQVLCNIMNNAIKFTHKGKICVSARMQGRTTDRVDIEFVIRDTGIGMTKEQLSVLFHPFTQADTSFTRKYGGTGLGMAISKQLVELMGGSIDVDSVLGEGTIFIINLSLPLDKQTHNEDEDTGDDSITLECIQGKKVLIVEDHKVNQDILRRILGSYLLDTHVADNGTEAVKKAKECAYDLILMDIQMPIMDGLAATKEIRSSKDSQLMDVPIIAMTAHAMESEYKKSLAAGMNGHLTKPIDIIMLEKTLFKYLGGNGDNAKPKPEQIDALAGSLSQVIDTRMGLRRFRMNKEMYEQSLDDFLEYENADIKLRQMLDDGDIDEARRLVHSIVGIAANLSMNNLRQTASNLEKELASSDDGSVDIECFSKELLVVINTIKNKEVFKKSKI